MGPTPEKTSKTRQAGTAQKRQDAGLQLWTIHKEESVFFQREAQVNFWTVLGGLAMAALLTQLSPLLEEFQASRWWLGLYFVASILVLANSWVQTTWGSLVMKWPIAILSTVIVIFQMLAQSIQCLLVTNPAGWLAATAALILLALCLQFYFERSGAWVVYPPETIKQFRITNLIYFFLMLVCLGGALHLHLRPAPLSEMIWGIASLLLSVLALYMQHRSMKEEKKRLGVP